VPINYTGSMPINKGSEVAVMKDGAITEIAVVSHAGSLYIELTDGRKFASIGGTGLNTTGSIEEAHDGHRQALTRRHRMLTEPAVN
jgi:hypothetical protein